MTMKERTYKGIITVYISHPTSVEQLSAVERAVYNALDSGDFDNNEYDIALDILSSDSMSVSDMSLDQEIGLKRAKQKLRDAEKKVDDIIKEDESLKAKKQSIMENYLDFIIDEKNDNVTNIYLNKEKIGGMYYGSRGTVRIIFYSNCKQPRLHCTEYTTLGHAKAALVQFYKLNHR